MNKLQYTIEEAYTDNVLVRKFRDGKEIYYNIVSLYALEGYVEWLENEGYERAYDVYIPIEKFVILPDLSFAAVLKDGTVMVEVDK